MTGDVIKSFLVGLGFGVDDATLTKFNKAIASATLKVAALYGATKIAAAAIGYGIAKISEGFEEMGYEYRLIIPAVNKAIALRREMLRAYSAAGVNIQRVVLQAYRLNFSLAKTKFAFEAIYKSVASRFFPLLTAQSDAFRNKLYANMPKIQAAMEKFVKFVFKALDATTELGMRLWSILGRVYDFFVMLDKATNGWSTIVVAMIAAWKLLNLEFMATPLGMLLTGLLAILALYDDFKVWQEGGKSFFDWTRFVPVINAVKNSIQSVWGVLKAVGEVLGNVAAAFYLLFQGDFAGSFDALKTSGEAVLAVFSKLWELMKNQLIVLGALGNWASGLSIFSGLFGTPGEKAGAAAGQTGGTPDLGRPEANLGDVLAASRAGNVAANIQNAPKGVPSVSPIGSQSNSNISNAQTNQNVAQQTSINVTGSADAEAIGRAVAGEQWKVNFDLVRNLKGATR